MKVTPRGASSGAEGGFRRQVTDLGLSKSAVDFHRQGKIIQELFCECNNYFKRFWQEITWKYEAKVGEPRPFAFGRSEVQQLGGASPERLGELAQDVDLGGSSSRLDYLEGRQLPLSAKLLFCFLKKTAEGYP